MFDYLFVSFEQSRSNWLYREVRQNTGLGESVGVSQPTYYARTAYKLDQIAQAQAQGVNLIRVGVEPAIFKASQPYIDPVDGLTYPSDLDMLDAIIADATGRGMVVQLQNSNDFVPPSVSLPFMAQLVDRYGSNPYVWINPANELNGMNGSGNVNNVQVWQSTMGAYMSALRVAGYTGPIVVNPPFFGQNLAGVVSVMASDARFSDDPCMIIGVHVYAKPGQSSFRSQRLAEETAFWWQYKNQYCIFIDETGIDNYPGRFDPALDPATPSVKPDEFDRMKAFMWDLLDWCWQSANLDNLQGVTGHMWTAYIPGMNMHDDNSMNRIDGSRTAWGEIFRSYSQRPNLQNGVGAPGEWVPYSPTVSSSAGALASFTSSGKCMRIGNTVWFTAHATITNNGTGAGEIRIGLPAQHGTPKAPSEALCAIQIVNDLALFARTVPGASYAKIKKHDGTYPGLSNAQFLVSGFFEVVPV